MLMFDFIKGFSDLLDAQHLTQKIDVNQLSRQDLDVQRELLSEQEVLDNRGHASEFLAFFQY